ncbi:hypothetical protein RRG08_022377 [Elysia crispata]|uniref:Uncharacterized protein n=1 Tax=Elysia crispata TaxID=231223 RepID=A0AAE0Z1I4_9GAST|nr:hypothetical protein RRG08_022377 [Elysia crispata]
MASVALSSVLEWYSQCENRLSLGGFPLPTGKDERGVCLGTIDGSSTFYFSSTARAGNPPESSGSEDISHGPEDFTPNLSLYLV